VVTTSIVDVLWLSAPAAPVMVSVAPVSGVEMLVPTVSVEAPAVGLGKKLHEAPDGSPLLQDSATAPVKPFIGVMVTV
jgi:hypothetical protein